MNHVKDIQTIVLSLKRNCDYTWTLNSAVLLRGLSWHVFMFSVVCNDDCFYYSIGSLRAHTHIENGQL